MTHFVGIGGIGMSALARLLLARGEPVSGSDVKRTPLIARLEAEGARVTIGHRAENVEQATRVIVSSAIDRANPEIARALERRIPVTTRGEMLAELTGGKKTIAVAGTHGKTTTTAMIAAVLSAGGVDPTIAIGGEPVDSGTNAHLGSGAWFVTESDESDGSFLHLQPHVAVVTNVENDHVKGDDEWQTLLDAFARFVAKIPSDGMLIAGADNAESRALTQATPGCPALRYGLDAERADLVARIAAYEDFGTRSEILMHGKSLGELSLRVPGAINVQNALAAFAAGTFVGIDFATIAKALDQFRGVRRRFEFLLRSSELSIVDDYAHHPTAVRETIATARRYHGGPLIVAFEPHRFTRTLYLAADFATALSGADRVILAPVYAASEPAIPAVSARSIGEPLAAKGTQVEYVDDVFALPSLLQNAPSGSLVLMLGAGSISEAAHRYAQSGVKAATA